jgi:hypothetical protein
MASSCTPVICLRPPSPTASRKPAAACDGPAASIGEKQPHARNRAEWVRVEAPELRIVSDAAWAAAHARIDRARRVYLAGTQGNL